MPTLLSLGEILAGLGLLFIGLKLLSANLQQAMGGRIRGLLRSATRSSLAGSMVGAVAGVVTQSSNAVAVISGNLVRARVLSARDAIPVVAGGNVGTSLVVVLAAINFHLAVLYLVGLVGIGFQTGLDHRAKLRDWMGVLLGLALLFLGIDFIKAAPHDLDVESIAALTQGLIPPVALVIGVVAATLTQSSSTATILALAGLKAGFFGADDCFFLVLGANLGSGLATFIAGGALVGVGRQLCYVQVLVKAIGTAALLGAWIVAALAGLDPEHHFSTIGGGDTAASVSLLFLALQIAGALPVVLFRGAAERFANRLSPPSREDHAARPRFVDPAALGDPSGALDLSAREIDALIGHLDRLLPDLDINPENGAADIRIAASGGAAIAATTDAFIVDLIRQGLSGDDLGEALGQQARLEIVRTLQATLTDFSATILAFETLPQLAFNLSEGLRLIVVQLVEAAERSAEDLDVLIAMTNDRSEHLNRLRSTLATTALGAETDAQRLLLVTSLFERANWLVHRLAIGLLPGRPSAPGQQL